MQQILESLNFNESIVSKKNKNSNNNTTTTPCTSGN